MIQTKKSSLLYLWIINAVVLALGFAYAGWQMLQHANSTQQDIFMPFQDVVIDSLYVDSMDTKLWLKQSQSEQYIEAQVLSEQAFLSAQVFQDTSLVGLINGKGIYILQAKSNNLAQIHFKKTLP